MEEPGERNWAAAHYRVERDSAGVVMRKRQRRKVAEDAAVHGDPVPGDPHDVVRIYDREGIVVFERDWGSNRASAVSQEAQIVDDLLRLEVAPFRAKWGIPEPIPHSGGDAPPTTAADPADVPPPDLQAGADAF